MSDKTFSESLRILQDAAEKIGQPATSLEEAFDLFDKGIRESEYMNEILKKAEQQIQIYQEEDNSTKEEEAGNE